MAEYSQTDKVMAIGIIERHGGVISKDALRDIRALLNAPEINKTTVYRWWLQKDKLVATPAQPKKRETASATAKTPLQPIATPVDKDAINTTLAAYFAQTAQRYLEHANDEDLIKETKAKDAVIIAATAFDKFRLASNLPTEILEIMPGLLDAIEKTGRDPLSVLSNLKEKLNAESQYAH